MDHFSALLHYVKGIASRLFGFFAVTEEELSRAGIYLDGKERDE